MKKSTIDCQQCKNANCFIKTTFSQDVIQSLSVQKMSEYHPQKNSIFHIGDPFEYIYFLYKGKVKILIGGAYNKEQAIRFCKAGEMIGFRGLIDSHIQPVHAQTITDCQICLFPQEKFFEYLFESNLSSKLFITFLANRLYEDDLRLKHSTIFNVKEKVANGILILIRNFGTNQANEINDFENITRQDFANLVGLTPNQVTRVFGELAKEKTIQIQKKKLIISNLAALKKITAVGN